MISIRCIHLKERDIEWLIKFEKKNGQWDLSLWKKTSTCYSYLKVVV